LSKNIPIIENLFENIKIWCNGQKNAFITLIHQSIITIIKNKKIINI